MNFKKFISSVSAIAIAASAFAAMTVTASAKEYSKISVTPDVETGGRRVALQEDGTYKTGSNASNYSYIVADFSSLEGIDEATSVTVEFDAKIIGTNTKLAKLAFGVGDKSVRELNCKGSTSSYKTDGLITAFGSLNGSAFVSTSTSSTISPADAYGKTVHAEVTLDRVNDKYTLDLSSGATPILNKTADTAVDNLTVVEAFTWGEAAFNITLKNIKVSYTVADPTPVAAGEVASFDNDEGACVYSATVTNDAAYTATTVKAVATAVGGATAQDSASVSVAPGSALEIAVIVEGKTADEIESVTVSLY